MQATRELVREVVECGRALARDEARLVLDGMLDGAETMPDVEIAALLTALSTRGETATELAGFVDSMRGRIEPMPLTEAERARLVDTCGTGGDGSGTFNISTGAALVAAGAGALVAKHGNRAVTSKCGSADVLEALGIAVALAPAEAVACLRATGFMFLYAPLLQPAMARVAPVRRALGFRTIFNLAGPLTNPAGATAQVVGVWAPDRMQMVADALGMLGARHAFVVHGDSGTPGCAGLDELTVTGTSDMLEVRQAEPMRRAVIEPGELGLTRVLLAALGGGGSAAESAALLEAIFRGEERGPRREVVLLNAAAALVVSGIASGLADGLTRAAEAVDSGRTLDVLGRLRAFQEQTSTRRG